MLGELSARYESNGDPGCISDGYGDPGGKLTERTNYRAMREA